MKLRLLVLATLMLICSPASVPPSSVIGWGSHLYPSDTDQKQITNIVAGNGYIMAVRNDSTVLVWGGNDSGQAAVPLGATNKVGLACGGEHEHSHVHDEHHQHAHDAAIAPGEPHSHWHRHGELVHGHPHFPDIHHRHSH
jgi:hypothetical protein